MNNKQNDVISYLNNAKKLLDTTKTFKDIYEYIINNNSKRVAFEYINDECKYEKIKYFQFDEHVKECAHEIDTLIGDKKGPVILKVKNSPQWCYLFWAILMSGHSVVLVDAKNHVEGVENLAKQSKAVAIITDDKNEYSLLKITVSKLERTKLSNNNLTWANEAVFCSSGTTGDVKLMVYNGENFVNQICASLDMGNTTTEIMYPQKYGQIKIFAMIPFHHIFGFVAVFLWYTFYGTTIVFPSSTRPDEIKELCQRHKITHIYSVPLFWDSIALGFDRNKEMQTDDKKALLDKVIQYNLGKISKKEAGKAAKKIVLKVIQKKILGNKVTYCISGGGYISEKTLETLNGIGYPLYNGFGMTEIGVTSVELSPDVNQRLKASIGKPLHGVSYKIDSEDGVKGELLVKSPITHIREIIGGKEQEASIDNEGYFRTGDIAEIDKDGYYYIKGRIKDIIINANGENIFPDELEIYFKKVNNVNNLTVVGIKQGKSHVEDIVVVVELAGNVDDEGVKKVIEEINTIGKNLPKGAKIDRVYFAKNKLPLANNMKVKRFVVKKAIEEGSDEYITGEKPKKVRSFDGYTTEQVQGILIPARELVAKILVLPSFKIDDDAHWINDLGGDSMNYVEFVQKLQDEFDVKIPEDKYGQLVCINDFVLEILELKNKKS